MVLSDSGGRQLPPQAVKNEASQHQNSQKIVKQFLGHFLLLVIDIEYYVGVLI